MYKALLFIVLELLIYSAVKAQKNIRERDTLVFYLKNSGYITRKDSADFSLLIMPRDPNDKKSFYPVFEFYPKGGRKMVANSSTHAATVVLEGAAMTFFPNGKRERTLNFKHGLQVGDETDYYPNGKLYAIKKIDNSEQVHYIECRDSVGHELTENGNGKWLNYNANFTHPEIADVVNEKVIDAFGFYFDTLKNIQYNNTGKIYSDPLVRATFKGGIDSLNIYLFRKIDHYTIAKLGQDTSNHAWVTFVIEKDGRLTHLHLNNHNEGRGIDENILETMDSSPLWVSASDVKQPVRSLVNLDINFSSLYHSKFNTDTTMAMFGAIGQQPDFPGGIDAFYKILMHNIHYPKFDRDNNVQGKVIVQFVIEKDGSLSNIKGLRGPSQSIISEAVRAVSLSPPWIPGMLNGKPVRVSYTVPISFTLGEAR